MASIKKALLFGILVWLVPFVIAFGFYDPQGGLTIDKIFFKTIMMLTGTTIGAVFIVQYYKIVANGFIREGTVVGLTWLLINWLLDLIILIPISDMPIRAYFMEIGLRYLTIPIFTVAIGYVLERKLGGNKNNLGKI